MPCRLWDLTEVTRLMTACIILHNMIVEESHPLDPYLNNINTEFTPTIQDNQRYPEIFHNIDSIRQNHIHLCQGVIHHWLTNDSKRHNWMQRGVIM